MKIRFVLYSAAVLDSRKNGYPIDEIRTKDEILGT